MNTTRSLGFLDRGAALRAQIDEPATVQMVRELLPPQPWHEFHPEMLRQRIEQMLTDALHTAGPKYEAATVAGIITDTLVKDRESIWRHRPAQARRWEEFMSKSPAEIAESFRQQKPTPPPPHIPTRAAKSAAAVLASVAALRHFQFNPAEAAADARRRDLDPTANLTIINP